MRLTAADIVSAIGQLPRNRFYHYVSPKTRTVIKIVDVTYPEGPITIRRFNPSNGGTPFTSPDESISAQMMWRIANAFLPNHPTNFDRVLGASYNTRSALEALLAHTPQFYYCYPGRIEVTSGAGSNIQHGHKHLMWCPDRPHQAVTMQKAETDIVISEVANVDVVYEALVLPDSTVHEIDIDIKRRHAQIQIALIKIGEQLGFRTWIAQNDKGIIYKDQRIGEMTGVVQSLQDEKIISAFDGASKAAHLIDCIWFKNGRLMPAVMEVEHSTGVTSGLARMKNLQDAIPAMRTRYVIVAHDDDRDKVMRETNKPQFKSLDTKFFPYSAVEELYALCERRKIRGVSEEFLDSFMESTLQLTSA